MDAANKQPSTESSIARQPNVESRSTWGAWLTLGRLVWIMLAAGYLVLWLASLPGYYHRVSTLTIEPVFYGERLSFDNGIALQQASGRGLSLPAYALYDIGYSGLQVLVCYAVAAIILWRTSSKFGWFTAVVLVLMAVPSMERAVRVADLFPAASLLILLASYLIWAFWILWLCLFPNGRILPQWLFLPISGMFAAFLSLQIASFLAVIGVLPAWIDTFDATFGPLFSIPLFGLILVQQIYRYRRISTPIERQQTKWFVASLIIFVIGLLVFAIFRSYFAIPYVQDIFGTLFFTFPISVAIAIIRYRLWDIDIIIRRTLIYGTLTAILALIYIGSVIVLQQIVSPLLGGNQQITIVASTLAIAVLFNPLRRRIQNVIDRRFFRRKYDAQKTLQAFSTRLRDETDLNKLSDDLLAVVQQTLQPAHVDLWLREPEREVQT